MNAIGVITLTTDFGLSDPYVGTMKGVILSIHPEAVVVDISHQIKAGSILHAAGVIQEAYPFFPKGTVHVGVIDPGVGGQRRPILLMTEDHFFVGPDNGLFWPLVRPHQPPKIIHLTETKYFLPRLSYTFHGRDIFAPVAAHLCRGVDPSKMGQIITDPVPLHRPRPREKGNILVGEVVRVDHFGNLVTNIGQENLARFLGSARPSIKVKNLMIEGLRKTYASVPAGEPLALIGSSNYLEIAVNLGRASDRLQSDTEEIIGTKVEVAKT